MWRRLSLASSLSEALSTKQLQGGQHQGKAQARGAQAEKTMYACEFPSRLSPREQQAIAGIAFKHETNSCDHWIILKGKHEHKNPHFYFSSMVNLGKIMRQLTGRGWLEREKKITAKIARRQKQPPQIQKHVNKEPAGKYWNSIKRWI